MATRILALLGLTAMSLSACGDTLLERGVTGAAVGAVGAELLDEDPVTGAVVGGGVGVATGL